MRKTLARIGAGALAAVTLIVGLPASPAHAINRVACAGRTDFATVHYALSDKIGTSECFANAGVMAVNIGRVHRVSSGNNSAMFNYESGGRYHTLTLQKWQSTNLGSVRVYEVRIF